MNHHLLSSWFPLTLIMFLAIDFAPLSAQEAQVKSVSTIYNREDQSRLKLTAESGRFQLFLDQSKLNIDTRLTPEQVVKLATEGKIPGMQPNKLRRKVTDTEIRVFSRQKLPDAFSLGGTTYHKIELDLGEEDGKRVITEAYASGNSAEEIAAAVANLNFQWDKLKIDKTCKNPVCVKVKELENGKEVCVSIKCDN